MQKIIIILSHCDSDKKKEVLLKNLIKLREICEYKIVLTSHIPLSDDVIDKVDFFVYDKSNPILKWPKRAFNHWKIINDVKLSYYVDDYGWTPFNQILKGYAIVAEENYDELIFMNYDLDINDEISNEINDIDSISKFYKVKNTYNDVSYPSLIFFKVNKKSIKKFINLIDLDFYLEKSHAESMLESISEVILSKKSDIVTKDCVDFFEGKTKDKFNNSMYNEFKLFVGYESPYKKDIKKYYFYNVGKKIDLKFEDNIINIESGENRIIETNSMIEILINGQYENLKYKKESDIQLIK